MSDIGIASALVALPVMGSVSAGAERDVALMERIGAGDLDAFEQLYRLYHPRLTRFLLTLTHRPTIVDEVLNDTMMAIWEKPASFRGRSRLSTWVLAIAYRKAMRALRRQDLPHESPANDEATGEAADGPLTRAQVHRLLVEAMAQLSPDHRAVIDLTYFHELGYRDIAEIMDCPVDTVKTRMFHARRHLKRLIAGTPADWL